MGLGNARRPEQDSATVGDLILKVTQLQMDSKAITVEIC